MNGPIANLIALGFITTVAMFPSPEALRTAVDPSPELAAPTGPRATPAPPPEFVSLLGPSNLVVGGSASSFPSYCVDTSTWEVGDLDNCATQLAAYIRMEDLGPDMVATVADASYNFVEEARASLAEICRSQWAAELSGKADMSPACEVLR